MGMSEQLSLDEALSTIEQQAREIERLRQLAGTGYRAHPHDVRFAAELREALIETAAAGVISAPVTHARLLEMIVETAAQVITANAASLFLIDEQTEELIFAVALGGKAEEVKNLRVPLGHGIAGLVAVSGQPMAISDAQSDPRQASDIAESVDYRPESILCVPLLHNEQVIGVLELLDKQGAPSFSPEDMEALWLFGNQAAVAIEQSRSTTNLSALLTHSVTSLAGLADDARTQQRAAEFIAHLASDDDFRRSVELAELVAEIVRQGASESRACHTILQSFADYLRARSMTGPEVGIDL
jgi:GAF domain-containing protein